MRTARTARVSIWVALALQLAGLAWDGVWHGVLNPGIEPGTFRDMLVHLGTVHLVLYVGVLGVLITTGWALVERRSGAVPAFVGALLSTIAEAWHASIHLRLSTRGGPIAEGVAVVGLLLAVVAGWAGGRHGWRLRASSSRERTAA